MRPVGVPTLLANNRLAAATGALRQQSETARTEVVTGRIADLPRVLGAGVSEALSLRGALELVAVRREAIAQANLVATAAQQALEDIAGGASSLATAALAANGRADERALGATAIEARAALETTFNRLNVRVAGQAIFAGDATDRAPLGDPGALLSDVAAIFGAAGSAAQFEADLDFYFNDPSGAFLTSIYRGGAGEAPTYEISVGERIGITGRADEQTVRDLLRGIATLAVAGAAPPSALRGATLSSAAAAAIAGADGVTDRRAAIGIAQQRAAAAAESLTIEEAALTEAYNEKTARDPFEAASRLRALEAQLDASYVLTSRLAQFSLVNYLR